MKTIEKDILKFLNKKPYSNQRVLSESSGYSIGAVNHALKKLREDGYIDELTALTTVAKEELRKHSPRNAIILAAGAGMRMVPINRAVPKALIEIKGEALIERQIKQLIEVGIRDITVVVGFMKEALEYLIDKYQVNLVVNNDYASTNTLSSLSLVADKISNTYIIPSDVWSKENPFSQDELYSWYMVSDRLDEASDVRANRKFELQRVKNSEAGNPSIGISYILDDDAFKLRNNLCEMSASKKHDNSIWEVALYQKDKMLTLAKIVSAEDVIEINTYQQLMDLDSDSVHLKSDAIEIIADTFKISPNQISDISILKKGMTNRSFAFSVFGEKYIMRIPGDGTEKLINRKHEVDVFNAIRGLGLCDDPIYINPKTGYKITKYLHKVRTCDKDNESDLRKCVDMLKNFHNMRLSVPHTFDIFAEIEYFESLWSSKSIFKDYVITKDKVFSLKKFIDSQDKDFCLTHIDAIPDNFLFYETSTGEKLQLTDWEYAGMQDPHVDIAMFSIYSMYNKEQVDHFIDIYFGNNCSKNTRAKIYCYISACGLLWSNWCEYKRSLGIEFGEYSIKQYRFAKEYYKYALAEM